MLAPEPFVLISKWGMLSPDGRCKTFDASANGFVRGEGCALLVLERLSDAQRERPPHPRRDPRLGHQPGRSLQRPDRAERPGPAGSGAAGPGGGAACSPPTSATSRRTAPAPSLGDPIEVEALAAVYGDGARRDAPLEIGSVKSNIGHLEAAAGVAGLIKVVLALQHRQLPASLHVQPADAGDRLGVDAASASAPRCTTGSRRRPRASPASVPSASAA